MKSNTLLSWLCVTGALFGAIDARAADNMASLAITPATGAVTLTPSWAIAPNLAGFHHMSQDLGLTGSVANNFYSLKAATIPAGGDILAFNFYVAGSGAATPHSDIGSKLTPSSYSALTSADPDVGYGSVNLYTIHHKGTTDYFTAIIPGSATSSAVTDEKPMSGPGGPGTVTGVSGYFGLTFAAANLGYGLNNFYYLRTDPATSATKFGTLAPALLGLSADQFDLDGGGHKALAFTGTDVGYGVNKMYYLRLDPVTGFTVLGVLDPAPAATRHSFDIANLGSVFSTLTFEPNDLGFGASRFYTTGTINPTWQSISFAPISNRAVSQGSFTVNPTASSALPITLTVVAGSTGTATISTPVGGVFTITPTGAGVVTLQATQAGAVSPTAYESNMLRQSFTVSGSSSGGSGLPVIINSPLTAAGTVGAAFGFTIAASNSPVTYSAISLPPGLAVNVSTGAITGTPTAVGVNLVQIGATNSAGTNNATLIITITAGGVAPIITAQPVGNASLAVGNTGTFTVAANGGSATTYQWKKDGIDITGATSATLSVPSVQSANVGFYTAVATTLGTSTTSVAVPLGITYSGQISGSATLVAAGIRHANGNLVDQFLLTGSSASIKANPGTIARISFIDLTNDIVHVDLVGAGVLTIKLDNASGPAAPVNYNQPGVLYMKGHATIAVTAADSTTNVSMFSVGRSNASDPSLFISGITYDGYADAALLTIASADGQFGGVRAANATFSRSTGMTGIYAPSVQFNAPVYVQDIVGVNGASSVMVLGSVVDARITGGDLSQDNGRPVEVSGMTRLQFTAGTSSHGAALPVQSNRARLMTNGVDVTAQVAP
jgi:hypothetical protein